jgi:EAL domain-containing protein (putative c-di-GMP-specific phosphodiesterase class I)/FixJ family two-component response regulator
MTVATRIDLTKLITPEPAGTALVFDDHHEVAKLLQLRLNQLGLATRCVTTSEEFFFELDASLPQFIFLDLALGSTDAIEMLEYLKGLKFTGRIVLMSGAFTLALDHVSRIGARTGLDIAGILKKPFRYWELQDLLGTLLTPKQASMPVEMEADHEVTLKEALDNGWIGFWYQPKVDLVSGSVVGAEALLRLNHPDDGALRPGPVFKNASTEEMGELLVRALDDVVANASVLRRQGRRLGFSINVAGSNLSQPELLDKLRERRADLERDVSVILEVTETDMVEDQTMAESFVTRALLHGFEVSIDDFGHGYATFERLRRMPFTEIKLERSMVDGCANDRALENICRASARLGHDFGAKVVAEGIEREVDLRMVRALGFDMAQGFLFSRPLPFADFMKLPETFTSEQAETSQAS